MFPLLLPLIGAGAGALLNKKDPLKGALMGGALGFGGGAIASGAGGGLLGAAPAAGSQAGMLAAQEAGMGLGSLGWKGATTGLQGAINSGAAGSLLDTAGNAAKTASTVKSLMPQEQPIQQSPLFTTGGGTQMGNVYQSMQQQRLALQQANEAMKLRRQQQIGLLG